MSSLRRKFSLGFTLLAWFFASGSQWDVMQIFAWSRMFASNVETMPVGEALLRTFRPEERCSMCNAISEGKQQQESAPPGRRLEDKSLLLCEPLPVIVMIVPERKRTQPGDQILASIERDRPPVPPPRTC